MASEIKLPELGENLEGGEVLDVRVSPGDTVTKGQPLLEIEAEKSTVEIPAPMAGRVTELRVHKGDQVSVGQTVCLIEAGPGESNGGPKTAPERKKPKEQAEPEPVKAPKQAGGRELAETLPPVKAPSKPSAKPTGDGDGEAKPAAPKPAPAAPRTGKLVPAGPATRRLARELGVDLHAVRGTARGGRVTPDDVRAYVRQLASGAAAPAAPGARPAVPPLPDFERWGPIEHVALEPVRRRTADQMSLAWSVVPHVTQHDRADITDLDAFRRQHADKGPKLTVTAFALKAAAIALHEFPQFNTSLDVAANQLVQKKYYHIGVAVDTERGLLVPVIRDVDKKSIFQLAQELTDIAERARQKKVQADEMRGGTFTITNLGGIGGTAFTPIVNYPEVAILGLSRARQEPVVRDGQVVARLMLPLSLSYDHRVIDGADAARFARRLAEMLENPLVMLLHA
jgi:pyruvate dehydrogenase E2 component (dihydrolipoamide acetyltransferase)